VQKHLLDFEKRSFTLKIGVTICLIGTIIVFGLYYYNNQYFTQRLVSAIAENNQNKVENLLKSKFGNVNSKLFMSDSFAKITDSNNPTPFYEACFIGNYEIVKMLINAGAKINTNEPIMKGTPLGVALSNINENRIAIANLLIDNGADVSDGISYVFRSTNLNKNGSKNIIKEKEEFDLFIKMVNKGASLSIVYKEGNGILHISAMMDNLQVVKYLVQSQKKDVNMIDNSGRTPIFYCQDVDTARFLLENGSDKTLKDKHGKTAYDYAIADGKVELAKLLKP
jgi:ankyrin repeat protein